MGPDDDLLGPLLDDTGELGAVLGPDRRIRYLNAAGRRLLGLTEGTVLPSAALEGLVADLDRAVVEVDLLPTLGAKGRWSGALHVVSTAGLPVPTRRRARRPVPRDHREHPHGRRGVHGGDPRAPEGARRAAGRGRLRDGLLLAVSLRRFPVDVLKVDQSFVSGLGHDPEDSAIVQAVVAMGRALRLTTVAEGVETGRHVIELRELDCDLAQGYHFARPVAAEVVSAMLDAGPDWQQVPG